MNNINLIPHPTYNLNNGTNNTIQNNPYNNSTHNNFNSTNNTTSLSHNNFNTNGNAIHYNNYIPPTNIYTYINPNMKTVPNIHNAHTSYTERPVFNEKSVLNTPINSQSNRPPSYSQLGNNYPSTYGLKLWKWLLFQDIFYLMLIFIIKIIIKNRKILILSFLKAANNKNSYFLCSGISSLISTPRFYHPV